MTTGQIESEEVYTVERILAEKVREGKIIYLVKWSDYSDAECTWEHAESFTSAETLTDWVRQKEMGDGLDAFEIAQVERRMQALQDQRGRESDLTESDTDMERELGRSIVKDDTRRPTPCTHLETTNERSTSTFDTPQNKMSVADNTQAQDSSTGNGVIKSYRIPREKDQSLQGNKTGLKARGGIPTTTVHQPLTKSSLKLCSQNAHKSQSHTPSTANKPITHSRETSLGKRFRSLQHMNNAQKAKARRIDCIQPDVDSLVRYSPGEQLRPLSKTAKPEHLSNNAEDQSWLFVPAQVPEVNKETTYETEVPATDALHSESISKKPLFGRKLSLSGTTSSVDSSKAVLVGGMTQLHNFGRGEEGSTSTKSEQDKFASSTNVLNTPHGTSANPMPSRRVSPSPRQKFMQQAPPIAFAETSKQFRKMDIKDETTGMLRDSVVEQRNDTTPSATTLHLESMPNHIPQQVTHSLKEVIKDASLWRGTRNTEMTSANFVVFLAFSNSSKAQCLDLRHSCINIGITSDRVLLYDGRVESWSKIQTQQSKRLCLVLFEENFPVYHLNGLAKTLEWENVVCWQSATTHGRVGLQWSFSKIFPRGLVMAIPEGCFIHDMASTRALIKYFEAQTQKILPQCKLLLPPQIEEVLHRQVEQARDANSRRQCIDVLTAISRLSIDNQETAYHETIDLGLTTKNRHDESGFLVESTCDIVYGSMKPTAGTSAGAQKKYEETKDELFMHYCSAWALDHLHEYRRFLGFTIATKPKNSEHIRFWVPKQFIAKERSKSTSKK